MTVPEEEGEVVGHGVRGAHQGGGHGRLQHSTQRNGTIIFQVMFYIKGTVLRDRFRDC